MVVPEQTERLRDYYQPHMETIQQLYVSYHFKKHFFGAWYDVKKHRLTILDSCVSKIGMRKYKDFLARLSFILTNILGE